jgi:hypothetical protein
VCLGWIANEGFWSDTSHTFKTLCVLLGLAHKLLASVSLSGEYSVFCFGTRVADSVLQHLVPSTVAPLSHGLLCVPLLFPLQDSLQVLRCKVQLLMQHATADGVAGLPPPDFTARMLLQRAGMEAAVEQLVLDEGLQQQLQGVLCTPQTSDVEVLQSLLSFLQSQLLRQTVQWQLDLKLLHLAGLVAGAVEETNRQQQQQQQQQQHKPLPSQSEYSSTSDLLDEATRAAAAAGPVAADQQQGISALQEPTALLVPELLWHSNGAEAAVLQLAAADPALQQQLLGLIHTPGTSPNEILAGMRLLLRNRMSSAVAQGSTLDLDVLQLASLVAAACDAAPPEQQQQQEQEASSPSASASGLAAAAASAADQQQNCYSAEALTPAMLRHRQGAEAAVLQLAAADAGLQQQLLGLLHTPATSPCELLNGMQLLLRNHFKAAVRQQGATTVHQDVVKLAELVDAACRRDAAGEQQQQQQQQGRHGEQQQQQQQGRDGEQHDWEDAGQLVGGATNGAAAVSSTPGSASATNSSMHAVPAQQMCQAASSSSGAHRAQQQREGGMQQVQVADMAAVNAAFVELRTLQLETQQQQQQQQQCGEYIVGDDEDSSMLYIPTDDEDA